jgi:hypothetical protein
MQEDGICIRLRVLFYAATLVALTTTGFSQQKNLATPNAAEKPSINAMELPLAFELNQGQTASHVRFLSRGSGYALFLTQDEAVLSMSKAGKTDHRFVESAGTVRLKLDGADHNVAVNAEGELASKNNYYIGNDPNQRRTQDELNAVRLLVGRIARLRTPPDQIVAPKELARLDVAGHYAGGHSGHGSLRRRWRVHGQYFCTPPPTRALRRLRPPRLPSPVRRELCNVRRRQP